MCITICAPPIVQQPSKVEFVCQSEEEKATIANFHWSSTACSKQFASTTQTRASAVVIQLLFFLSRSLSESTVSCVPLLQRSGRALPSVSERSVCTYYFQPRKNIADHRTEKYSTSLGTTILNVVCWWARERVNDSFVNWRTKERTKKRKTELTSVSLWRQKAKTLHLIK